jgi:hypothetical protein
MNLRTEFKFSIDYSKLSPTKHIVAGKYFILFIPQKIYFSSRVFEEEIYILHPNFSKYI